MLNIHFFKASFRARNKFFELYNPSFFGHQIMPIQALQQTTELAPVTTLSILLQMNGGAPILLMDIYKLLESTFLDEDSIIIHRKEMMSLFKYARQRIQNTESWQRIFFVEVLNTFHAGIVKPPMGKTTCKRICCA